MLITKTNPVDVDVPIQKLQTKLHGELVKMWRLTNDDSVYRAYGRCYRNKTDDGISRTSSGYIAENYEGYSEYKEVYWDDTLSAISFFGINEKQTVTLVNEVDVHLVFFANVVKLKPDVSHRADAEIRNDVQTAFGVSAFGFQLLNIELWLENVLREYPGSRRDDRLKYVDMQPVHCFRFNFHLRYDFQNCSTLKLK